MTCSRFWKGWIHCAWWPPTRPRPKPSQQPMASRLCPGEHGRLFGRDIVAFHRFEDLLDDATHKQKAWALLKSFPRLDQN